ncbi:unnamed protein product [Rotaria socialis]|uniref:SAM domain-containing protein n=1 Tax=Rotaria socialis TaxID=392032 RepID=A0A821AR34_9BILA|nr:unnamed protein product [Rotaria socialis]CAF3338330.1 unnamed protein product [Rotaria socialis]CAF4498750.1 unnamed protein product [Rotaria socialis]CAF4580565.1 unnamed protein product [Rotaria socialis]
MSKNNDDHLIKSDNHSCGYRGRSKSSIVRDSNGSASTFRRFYQSGGRDYEQYRRWLKTLSESEQQSSPMNSSNEMIQQPRNIESNVNSELRRVSISSSSKFYPQQFTSAPKITHVYPLLKPIRHRVPLKRNSELSLPLPTFLSSLSTATSFESHNAFPREYFHIKTESISSPTPFTDWSVTDVVHFIKQHFPEKHIARKFMQQKIDGSTLPLLTEDHLTRIFKMKLGPALHLLTLISTMQMHNFSNNIER